MSDDNDLTQNTQGGTGTGTTNDAPEWARNAISKANNEAADFRVKLRTKTEEHTSALAQIESLTGAKSDAEARAAAAEKELLKYKTAVAANVPGEQADQFASLLQGDNEEELKAHAEKLLSMFGAQGGKRVPATDRSQGQGADETPGLSEGAAFLANALQGRFN